MAAETPRSQRKGNNQVSNVLLSDSKPSATPQVTTAYAPVFGLRRPLIQHNVKKVIYMRQ